METLSATTIFWLITIGLITGWIVGYWIGHEGITLWSNLAWGVLGSLVVGGVALWLELGGILVYAFMGTLGTLFIANVFHQHHLEDVFGDVDRSITVRRHPRGTNHKSV